MIAPDTELTAILKVNLAVEGLGLEARQRVLNYAWRRHVQEDLDRIAREQVTETHERTKELLMLQNPNVFALPAGKVS